MIEHVSIPVRDYEKAKAFYLAALKPLGYKLNMEFPPDAAGFMEGGHTSFWIARKDKDNDSAHLAFLAKSEREVQDFYKAALGAGGKDNGAPGLRDYSPGYYAAFVFDPDGNNVEAVFYKE